jgi:hypothetical protein
MSRLSRRQVVQGMGAVGLGLVAGCGRLPFPGLHSPPRVPTIGYLSWNAPGSSSAPDTPEPLILEQLRAFRQGLSALGYVEGQNIIIEYRFTDRSEAQWRQAAEDLVRLEVAVIVTQTPSGVRAAQGATSTIPIVFLPVSDPVGSGLVAHLARPGGNITGLTNISTQLSGKRLDLLAQAVPGLRHVAFLRDALAPASFVAEMQTAAQALGLRFAATRGRRRRRPRGGVRRRPRGAGRCADHGRPRTHARPRASRAPSGQQSVASHVHEYPSRARGRPHGLWGERIGPASTRGDVRR